MNSRTGIKFFVAMMACLALGSCEKTIKPDKLPSQDSRPVVNVLLYHDSLIKVHISMSRSILSAADYKLRDDAICELFINDKFSEKIQSSGNGYYKSSAPGRSGYKYTIKATVPGNETVEG